MDDVIDLPLAELERHPLDPRTYSSSAVKRLAEHINGTEEVSGYKDVTQDGQTTYVVIGRAPLLSVFAKAGIRTVRVRLTHFTRQHMLETFMKQPPQVQLAVSKLAQVVAENVKWHDDFQTGLSRAGHLTGKSKDSMRNYYYFHALNEAGRDLREVTLESMPAIRQVWGADDGDSVPSQEQIDAAVRQHKQGKLQQKLLQIVRDNPATVADAAKLALQDDKTSDLSAHSRQLLEKLAEPVSDDVNARAEDGEADGEAATPDAPAQPASADADDRASQPPQPSGSSAPTAEVDAADANGASRGAAVPIDTANSRTDNESSQTPGKHTRARGSLIDFDRQKLLAEMEPYNLTYMNLASTGLISPPTAHSVLTGQVARVRSETLEKLWAALHAAKHEASAAGGDSRAGYAAREATADPVEPDSNQ